MLLVARKSHLGDSGPGESAQDQFAPAFAHGGGFRGREGESCFEGFGGGFGADGRDPAGAGLGDLGEVAPLGDDDGLAAAEGLGDGHAEAFLPAREAEAPAVDEGGHFVGTPEGSGEDDAIEHALGAELLGHGGLHAVVGAGDHEDDVGVFLGDDGEGVGKVVEPFLEVETAQEEDEAFAGEFGAFGDEGAGGREPFELSGEDAVGDDLDGGGEPEGLDEVAFVLVAQVEVGGAVDHGADAGGEGDFLFEVFESALTGHAPGVEIAVGNDDVAFAGGTGVRGGFVQDGVPDTVEVEPVVIVEPAGLDPADDGVVEGFVEERARVGDLMEADLVKVGDGGDGLGEALLAGGVVVIEHAKSVSEGGLSGGDADGDHGGPAVLRVEGEADVQDPHRGRSLRLSEAGGTHGEGEEAVHGVGRGSLGHGAARVESGWARVPDDADHRGGLRLGRGRDDAALSGGGGDLGNGRQRGWLVAHTVGRAFEPCGGDFENGLDGDHLDRGPGGGEPGDHAEGREDGDDRAGLHVHTDAPLLGIRRAGLLGGGRWGKIRDA